MAERLKLSDLLDEPAVMGAVRWKETVLGKGATTPPQLVEKVGDISDDRAERLMQHAEAGGMAIFAIGQLSRQRAPGDKTTIYPIDAYYVHGEYCSVAATINRVAVLLDNEKDVDIKALIRRMILVDNY